MLRVVEKSDTLKYCRIRSNLAISVISSQIDHLPIENAANKADMVIALASFTLGRDPWSTTELTEKARAILQKFVKNTHTEVDSSAFWSVIEEILKERIKPLFAKTRNPAITATGRKNFHPVPLARFDTSILDPDSKPWKAQEVYSTTVFAWIVGQYRVCFPYAASNFSSTKQC